MCNFIYYKSLLIFQAETNALSDGLRVTLFWCGSHPQQEPMSVLPECEGYSSVFKLLCISSRPL